jgi:acyl-CoA reductase-like NAD-dependent aldehyde dehydrogenase
MDTADPPLITSHVEGGPAQDASATPIEVVDPWRGAPACRLAPGGEGLVGRAAASARAAFARHRRATRAERATWLEAAAEGILEATDRLAELAIRDIGKPRRAALFEVRRSAAFVRACVHQIHDFGGEVVPLDTAPAGAGLTGFAERVPYGVVGAVTPFNAPANLLVQKVAPALVTGNAVVVKPAPEGARVALEIARIFEAGGLPPGLFNVVLGGRDEALALAAHSDVALVTLTGGTAAGEALARAAGAKRFVAELGGNSANLVLADADLDEAVARIAPSAFEASGQQCISAQRVIVEEAVHDAFLERFVAAAGAMRAGDPDDAATDLGPVVHARAAERIMGLIAEAEAAGARVLAGPGREGCLIRPTVIADAPADARIVREEIFGPVAVVMRAEDTDDAIRLANDCEFGLQASCFTRDIEAAFRVSRELEAGSVWINEGSRFRLDGYPFGGFGKSGYGREGVRYAMEEYTTWKFTGIRLPAAR